MSFPFQQNRYAIIESVQSLNSRSPLVLMMDVSFSYSVINKSPKRESAGGNPNIYSVRRMYMSGCLKARAYPKAALSTAEATARICRPSAENYLSAASLNLFRGLICDSSRFSVPVLVSTSDNCTRYSITVLRTVVIIFIVSTEPEAALTMPKTALKQKTRQKAKTASRSPFESTRPTHDDSDVEMDSEASDADEDVPEKDEAEKKLERMLFGDDEGFHGALKSHQTRSLAALSAMSDDEAASEKSEGEEGEEKDLDDMADDDVCGLPLRLVWFC